MEKNHEFENNVCEFKKIFRNLNGKNFEQGVRVGRKDPLPSTYFLDRSNGAKIFQVLVSPVQGTMSGFCDFDNSAFSNNVHAFINLFGIQTIIMYSIFSTQIQKMFMEIQNKLVSIYCSLFLIFSLNFKFHTGFQKSSCTKFCSIFLKYVCVMTF